MTRPLSRSTFILTLNTEQKTDSPLYSAELFRLSKAAASHIVSLRELTICGQMVCIIQIDNINLTGVCFFHAKSYLAYWGAKYNRIYINGLKLTSGTLDKTLFLTIRLQVGVAGMIL